MVGGIVREITARPLFYFNNCTFNRRKNENSVAPSHKRHLERTDRAFRYFRYLKQYSATKIALSQYIYTLHSRYTKPRYQLVNRANVPLITVSDVFGSQNLKTVFNICRLVNIQMPFYKFRVLIAARLMPVRV